MVVATWATTIRLNACVLPHRARPQHVVGRGAGPLLQKRSVGGGRTDDVDALAAMTSHDLEVAATRSPEELLVVLTVAGPLDDARPVGCRGAVHVEAETAVAADDVVVAAAGGDERPLLPCLLYTSDAA